MKKFKLNISLIDSRKGCIDIYCGFDTLGGFSKSLVGLSPHDVFVVLEHLMPLLQDIEEEINNKMEAHFCVKESS